MGGAVGGILLVGLGVLLAVYKRMRASALPLKSRASCKSRSAVSDLENVVTSIAGN
jgi:hypothetical protein